MARAFLMLATMDGSVIGRKYGASQSVLGKVLMCQSLKVLAESETWTQSFGTLSLSTMEALADATAPRAAPAASAAAPPTDPGSVPAWPATTGPAPATLACASAAASCTPCQKIVPCFLAYSSSSS